MIEKRMVASYRYICDDCGWRAGSASRPQSAEFDGRVHKCGVHRQQYDSTGGFRGILGGWNVYCICGERYITEDPSAPFACPEAPQ